MPDFTKLHIDTGKPVYPQVTNFIKLGIIRGEIISGCELPSRRELALIAGINPNTAQKAYKALEDEGIIATESTVKSKIVFTREKYEQIKEEMISQLVNDFISQAKETDLSFKDAIELITKFW